MGDAHISLKCRDCGNTKEFVIDRTSVQVCVYDNAGTLLRTSRDGKEVSLVQCSLCWSDDIEDTVAGLPVNKDDGRYDYLFVINVPDKEAEQPSCLICGSTAELSTCTKCGMLFCSACAKEKGLATDGEEVLCAMCKTGVLL